jgi:uridine kinase
VSTSSEPTLFDLPPGAREVPHRIVLITGPSGSGKTWLTRRLGLPSVALDDFYFDNDHPGMPRRYGIVDWDSPDTWDTATAMATLIQLACTGEADVPVYDIPTSHRTGITHLTVGDSPVIVAEGIFASEIVDACRREGILADAYCLRRPRVATFTLRLLRDFGEMRKPPVTLLRRGIAHLRAEPDKVRRWVAMGCRPETPSQAEREIRALAGALTQ